MALLDCLFFPKYQEELYGQLPGVEFNLRFQIRYMQTMVYFCIDLQYAWTCISVLVIGMIVCTCSRKTNACLQE